MARALRERGGQTGRGNIIDSDNFITVLDCLRDRWIHVKQNLFFKLYQQMGLQQPKMVTTKQARIPTDIPPPHNFNRDNSA